MFNLQNSYYINFLLLLLLCFLNFVVMQYLVYTPYGWLVEVSRVKFYSLSRRKNAHIHDTFFGDVLITRTLKFY